MEKIVLLEKTEQITVSIFETEITNYILKLLCKIIILNYIFKYQIKKLYFEKKRPN